MSETEIFLQRIPESTADISLFVGNNDELESRLKNVKMSDANVKQARAVATSLDNLHAYQDSLDLLQDNIAFQSVTKTEAGYWTIDLKKVEELKEKAIRVEKVGAQGVLYLGVVVDDNGELVADASKPEGFAYNEKIESQKWSAIKRFKHPTRKTAEGGPLYVSLGEPVSEEKPQMIFCTLYYLTDRLVMRVGASSQYKGKTQVKFELIVNGKDTISENADTFAALARKEDGTIKLVPASKYPAALGKDEKESDLAQGEVHFIY
jgi:anti-sigma28 factor (negative regulator of flagellin synthesis)